MSLNGALQIGASAIAASQAAIQVAGNNMANAATPGYHRQVATIVPARPEQIGPGQFIGQGVQIQQISRAVDTALQARLRDAISEEQASLVDQQFLTAIETLQNELTDNDLSTLLSEFFNAFSELANTPQADAVRSVVVEQAGTLTNRIQGLHGDYGVVREEIDRSLATAVEKVDNILDQIALLNTEITQVEQGVGQANSLRDQRDVLISELAEYLDVSVVEQPNGSTDILVGSIPIVLAGESRGLDMRTESSGDMLDISIRVRDDQSILDVRSGRIGALLNQREETVQPTIQALEDFTGQLIFQVNRLHAQGQGVHGYDSLSSAYGLDDNTVSLNSPDSGIPFPVGNGSFMIHVTHSDTGLRTTHQIDVDGNSMSLDDVIDEINLVVGVPNVTAALTVEKGMSLTAAAGYEITFSDDSSDFLAAMGINNFFSGDSPLTIDVNERLRQDPGLLAAGSAHIAGSNDTALAIASLQDVSLDALGGRSLRQFWQGSINQLAVRADAANTAVESSRLVRESLNAQAQAVSGVSLDEESIKLLSFQRQFQAAARFISVIDETLQTLLSIA